MEALNFGRRGLLASLGSLAMLPGCGLLGREQTYRYKMTLIVDTPSGEKRGSATREITYIQASKLPSIIESRSTWNLDGEAVAIDIAPGQSLFALLEGGRGDPDYATWLMPWLVGPSLRDLSVRAEAAQFSLWPNAPESMLKETTDPLPRLVCFSNPLDQQSIREVNPANLEATFGPGVSLREVQVGLTDEPITRAIERRLPWLRTIHPGALSGTFGVSVRSPNLADRVSTGAFIMRSNR